MSTREEYCLGDICQDISYGYTASATKHNTGCKFLRITDIQFDHIDWQQVPYCAINKSDFYKNKLEIGDIVIARTGNSTGETAVIKDKIDAVFASYLIRFRINSKIANPLYVSQILRSKDWKNFIGAIKGGSAQPGANAKVLSTFELTLPPLPLQHRIAEILGALDDKIELNRQMNHTLEQMAQALYKHYFVDDIDPENLPEGWSRKFVGEYIDTISKTHKFPKSTIIFLNTSDVYDGMVLHSKYSSVESLPGQAKKSIQIGDILYSEIRPENRRYAFINFKAENYVVSTKLMVLRSKTPIDSIFFYYLLTRPMLISDLHNLAEARSGTFPQITFDQIKEISFILPSSNFLSQFIDGFLKPTYDQIFSNNTENQHLSSIRDILLPKLISGEILPSDLQPIEQAL